VPNCTIEFIVIKCVWFEEFKPKAKGLSDYWCHKIIGSDGSLDPIFHAIFALISFQALWNKCF
jgi:hypothetical protein